MLRSMFAAISALRNHQTYMDVVSNNIANINTPGYKGSRVSFADALAQTIRGASAPDPTTGRGGINPMQVGLGMSLGGIQTLMGQGDFQPTGRATDLAVEGEGFFLVSNGQQLAYTRDGSFDVDSTGVLVNPSNGLKLQGWSTKDANGNIVTSGIPGEITIPLESTIPGTPSSSVTLSGNLSSATSTGETVTTQVPIYDTLGQRHLVTLTFTNATLQQWDVTAAAADANQFPAGTTISAPTPASITFGPNGTLPANANNFTLNIAMPAGGPTVGANGTGAVTFNLASLTQLSGDSAVNATAQDGFESGSLVNFTIGSTGQVIGIFSNGFNQTIAQIALATFPSPSGLNKEGGNIFTPTPASGQPILGTPGSGGRGTLASGVLEMSNVNLAQQFTNMISAERGFQANARMITASDEMLQDLINLKR